MHGANTLHTSTQPHPPCLLIRACSNPPAGDNLDTSRSLHFNDTFAQPSPQVLPEAPKATAIPSASSSYAQLSILVGVKLDLGAGLPSSKFRRRLVRARCGSESSPAENRNLKPNEPWM